MQNRKQDPFQNNIVPAAHFLMEFNSKQLHFKHSSPQKQKYLSNWTSTLSEKPRIKISIPLAGSEPPHFHIKAVRIIYTIYVITWKYSSNLHISNTVWATSHVLCPFRLKQSSDPGEIKCYLPMSARHQDW